VSDFGIYEVLAGQTGEWTTVLSPLSIDFLNCIVGIPAKYQLMTLGMLPVPILMNWNLIIPRW